jgi:glycosyltransferase involved in cell wall biosynthesis
MKVCMVGFFVYSGDGRVKGYAESLVRANVSVDVLSIHGFSKSKAIAQNGVRVFRIPIRRTRKNPITYIFEYGSALLLLGFLLTRMFIKEHYDVIHVHNMPDFLVFSSLIPKMFGAKIILDIHDPMPEVYLSKFPKANNDFGVKLIRLEEKVSTRFADAVITANSHFRKNLITRGVQSSKITVVHNFPDPNIFSRLAYSSTKEKKREHFTLIFPGTIAPRYGLEVAIRAMPQIKSKIKNVKLLIIGQEDGYAKSLVSLANQLGVASVVEFRPAVRLEAIPKLLAQADIGIYPALPDPHMRIAVPGKLLEFAAMGIPVLSSRLEIVEEIFGDTAAVLFEPGNSNQFAKSVIKLYKNPRLREKLIHNADRTILQKRSWEQEFIAYLNVLARLLPEEIKTIDTKYFEKIEVKDTI